MLSTVHEAVDHFRRMLTCLNQSFINTLELSHGPILAAKLLNLFMSVFSSALFFLAKC